MSKDGKVSVQDLENEAEANRVNGNRDIFLKLKQKIRDIQEKEVQEQHNVYFKAIEKEFPVGSYIKAINATIKELKHGCGTQRGWIEIYISNHEHSLKPHELRKRIQDAENCKEASIQFDKLKFSDRKKSFYLGLKNYDTLDMLIRVMDLDLPTLEEVDEMNMDYFGEIRQGAIESAKADGYSDEEAEKKGDEREAEEMTENSEKYLEAILKTLNYLLNSHHLELNASTKGYYLTTTNQNTWKETAQQVAETITGYGMFEYQNAQALKDGLPCKTFCEAALQHLHWFKHYPAVYGNTNYKEIYNREWR